MADSMSSQQAVGSIETKGFPSVLAAADAMLLGTPNPKFHRPNAAHPLRLRPVGTPAGHCEVL